MSKYKHTLKKVAAHGRRAYVVAKPHAKKAVGKTVHHSKKIARKSYHLSKVGAQKSIKKAKVVHRQVAVKPHQYLTGKWALYRKWHDWRWHQMTHYSLLGLYMLVIGVTLFRSFSFVLAADLSNNWDFSNASDYTLDSGVENTGSAARLKAQNYSSDANTSALYHLDESSGTTASDSSANANNLSLQNSPTFGTGNLNNGLTLNGTTQFGSASDSSSLSPTSQQTLEGWFKPGATYDNTANSSQTLIDKGSYKVGLDRTSGKIYSELQNNNLGSWTRQMGGEVNGSWSTAHYQIDSSANDGTNYYVGTGGLAGDAEVWKWNGSSWSKLGGDSLNGSWADFTYESVTAMEVHSGSLFIGLGVSTVDGEVWSCSLVSNCSSWSKIAGDGVGIIGLGYEAIRSMVSHDGKLYIGTGDGSTGSGTDGDVYRYESGTTWTQIGGDGLNSGWAANTNETIVELTSDGTSLYAGTGGLHAGDGEVWKWNGTIWTKLGGDGLNSSWNTVYETVNSIMSVGSDLYAGTGNSTLDAEVWKLSGGTWSKIGGDGVGSSWSSAGITNVLDMVNDGTNIYATLGSTSALGQVYSMPIAGSTWTLIGGNAGNNNSWTGANSVGALEYFNSQLYATPWTSGAFGSGAYTWNGSSWTTIGGGYLNGSWGGQNTGNVSASTVMNGKMYVGLGAGLNNAMVYEWDGTTANIIGGGSGVNGSWGNWTYESITSMTAYNGKLYVGTGIGNGDGEVWRWDFGSWTKVGGDGLNNGMSATIATVDSMTVYKGKLYAGTGSTLNNGHVWEYDGSTWTKVAGTGVANTFGSNDVMSMSVYNDQLCVGNGGASSQAQVWCWSGSGAWTRIAGAGLNSSWASTTSKFMSAMAIYNDKLYVTLSDTLLVSEVWSWDGTTWSQIGGAGLNSGWQDGSYSQINALSVYNGDLYAATGYKTTNGSGAGDVWRYNGTGWTQIGGDNLNGGWGNTLEVVSTLTQYKGKLYAGTGFTANADANVYSIGNNGYVESTTSSFNSSWHHFAASYNGSSFKLYIDGTQEASQNSSFTITDNTKSFLVGKGIGSANAGYGESFFNGSLDEIRISDTARSSFTTKPYSTTAQGVVLADSVRNTGVEHWDGLASSETANGGAISYQLSDDDGTTWKYWTGSAWSAVGSNTDSNNISIINTNIATFPTTFDGIKWKAILLGDGNQRVQLNSVTLTATSDSLAPETNASAITAKKSNGGASLASNGWTNGASPYFTWTAGTDSGSDILGYCLYLGQTGSSDPISTKGLLGTSPVNTGGNCQFAISGNTLDLSLSGLLGTALTSSDDPYYLNIKAIDNAGNIFDTSEQFQFRFDNTPPTNPGFVSAPSSFINTKSATLTWPTGGGQAANDDNSGVAGLQYKIGNTTWYGDSHTGTGDINDLLANDGNYTTVDPTDFDNINDGVNTFSFRTWDQAGNISSSTVTAALKVNTSGAPSEPQNLQATPSTNTTNSFAFSWDAPATFNTTTGNADKLSYCYTVNTLPTANNCIFTSAGVTSLNAGSYATQPGANTFYVVAKDDFNAISYSSYTSVTFTANTSAPGMPLNTDIVDVSVKSTSNWRLAVTWDTPDDVGAGIASYKLYRSTDNSGFTQVGTSSSTSFVDANLSQQTYYYKVKACDSANNCGAYGTTVSMLPTGKFTTPAVITSEPIVTNTTTKKATVSWSTDRASDSKISLGTQSGTYSPSEVGNSDQVTAHVIDLDNLAAGTTYYFKTKWTDEDGNTGTSQEYTFTTSPAPVLKEVNTLSIGLSNATIQFTTKDSVKTDINYGKSDSFGGIKTINTSSVESTYAMDLAGLDDGTKYFYRLTMYDSEGGSYQSSIFSLTTPQRPKISNLKFQPVPNEPTSTQQVTWTTNVATNSSINFGKIGTTGIIQQSQEMKTTHEMIIRGLEDDSEYFLFAEGRDANGNLATSERQVFKTALDTRAPEITDITIEPAIRGSGVEARGQIVVSWKTDEPSTSQVAFAEGSNVRTFNNRTAEDGQLTTEHLVIVSDLPPSKVYSIVPVSRDKASNTSSAEPHAAIIGRASDNVLNIVLNTLKKVFGF